jgi:Holliday junction resolvase RusA-like endonuclease
MTPSPSELKALLPNASLTVTLPLPPKELSPNARTHWAKKANAVKSARREAYIRARNVVIHPPLWSAASVQIRWFTRTATRPDADNALASCKPIFDGLTDARIFSDDKDLAHLPIIFAKDPMNPRIELTITPTE